MKLYLSLLSIIWCLPSINAFLPGLYCGEQNCYEVLSLDRDATKSQITKAYRSLAKKHHPDRVRGDEQVKKEAGEKFTQIAAAYETLKDEESRRDYDYMLDNPDEYYYHYYNYYRRRVAPKVDVRIVILVTILVISIVQYISSYHKYTEAVSYLLTQHKYRLQAVEIATKRGLLGTNQKKPKRKQDKAEAKEREEQIIKSIIEENIDIKGGHGRPSIFDVLVFQIVMLPYYIYCYIYWWINWIWRFNIKGEEYGDEEKLHIIRKYLKLSQTQFDSLGEPKHHELLDAEAWIYSNFLEWKQETEELEKTKLAENSRFKRYRRYMKNQGPGQISFVDED